MRSLCKTAILLDKGRLLLKDNVDNVISEYMALNKKTVSFFDKSKGNISSEPIKVVDSKIICSDQSLKMFSVTEKIGICFIFKVNKCLNDIFIKVKLFLLIMYIFDSLDLKGSKSSTSWNFPKNCLDRQKYA